MSGDAAPKKHCNLRAPWRLGESGNPNGRPKGSRNKLGQQFIDDTYAKWLEKGDSVLDRVIAEEPAQFLKIVAALILPHFKVEHDHEHALLLSEDELRARLLEVRKKLLDLDVDPELLGPPIEGESA